MSLKLQSIIIAEGNPKRLICQLYSNDGQSMTVNVLLHAHHQVESMTISEIEKLAHEAAKHLIP